FAQMGAQEAGTAGHEDPLELRHDRQPLLKGPSTTSCRLAHVGTTECSGTGEAVLGASTIPGSVRRYEAGRNWGIPVGEGGGRASRRSFFRKLRDEPRPVAC
ncbi:MAG: hypothetical protein ACYTG0_24670, partial [Planctomycetota bacterium]